MNPLTTSPLELCKVTGACTDGSGVGDISTVFPAGRLHLLRGTPESGKVALFRFAGLLEKPLSGDVLIQGGTTQDLAEEARTELRTQRLGFAFSVPFLLTSFNVIENVAMPLFKISQVGPDEARRRTEAILNFVGLSGAAEAGVAELTVPAQYHVAIARGLVNEPAVLLVENLDGALSGADLDHYVGLLRKAASTYDLAVIATASPELKPQPGDRVLDIERGVIVRDSEFLPEICE